MELAISIKLSTIEKWKKRILVFPPQWWLFILSLILAIGVSIWSVTHGYNIAYGDSESHLNIAKRVVSSLTPGFAQLGGIWLPVPHVLMIPFVYFDPLWRTGIAGAIVSGIAFLISTQIIYRLVLLISKDQLAAFLAGIFFIGNLNVLYMQSTAMSELPLICFFLLSSYYFIKFLYDDKNLLALILAGAFGFIASLSRYDGWFLVAAEAGVLVLYYLPWQQLPKSFKQVKEFFNRERWQQLEGKLILFSTIAFFGILLWFLWDYLILGSPFYFANSEFSARTQQIDWQNRGMLVTRHNLWLSVLYFLVTSMANAGIFMFALGVVGFIYFLKQSPGVLKWFVVLILFVPLFFNVISLFLGQSIIFIPHLTPSEFEWRLFNVRYGLMLVPVVVIFSGLLFHFLKTSGRLILIGLFIVQFGLYYVGYSKVITYMDGTEGLSSAISKMPDVQQWIQKNYDGGLVLVDDYARTMSIIRSGIPMQNIIYIGNRGWWDDSFKAPEKYATWIIMQKNDVLWKKLYEDPGLQGRVYKYFNKTYTSPDILVFKRNPNVPIEPGDEIPSTIPKNPIR